MTYSQDAELGHSFAAVYEWVIEGRPIPVIPIFVNTYLPPLPTVPPLRAIGRGHPGCDPRFALKIAIVASGGMSHYPGAWKYPQPAFDFDWWAIAHMERGNNEALLELIERATGRSRQHRNAALDDSVRRHRQAAGRTDHLSAHLASRPRGDAFHPQQEGRADHTRTRRRSSSSAAQAATSSTGIPIRPFIRSTSCCTICASARIVAPPPVRRHAGLAAEYGLNEKQAVVLETMKDESIDAVRSLKPHPLVDAGAHPLGMWMSLITVQAEQRRMRAEQAQARQ